VGRIKATNGDTQLGGDNLVTHHRWIAVEFKRATASTSRRPDGAAALKEAAEKAKMDSPP